jgi:beta-galactosidase/beta-glucuronidase
MSPMPRQIAMLVVALVACLALPAGASAAAKKPMPPKAFRLSSGWEVRDAAAAPALPQPPPPDESQPDAARTAKRIKGKASQASDWRPVRVPGVFDADAAPALFPGTVKIYRLRFRAPKTKSFKWAFRFEEARRRATVFLNGRRLGVSIDPYTPFEMDAKGLEPGKINELSVTVDSRKDPALAEGWWNWGGINRPVWMIPRGKAEVRDFALLPDVACKGQARSCRAGLLVDGILTKLPKEKQRYRKVVVRKRTKRGTKRAVKRVKIPLPQPKLTIKLKSPVGRVTKKTFELKGLRSARRRLALEMRVPAPKLWSPEKPQLYASSATITYKGKVEQVIKRNIGLRSVKVKQGLLFLNNRQIQLRGASIHEDYPGDGAATTGADMDTTVRELKELGANVTRAHYLLSDGLLKRFDKAGILVWNEAAVWQRDVKPNLLRTSLLRSRAIAQVRRTVLEGRNHPSVITHSVANELTFTPDSRPATRRFLVDAVKVARDLDPTIPISLDIKGRPGYGEQFTYQIFDMLGINQYFGWYPWVEDFNGLDPFLREMRDFYPNKALVMTEFGAEGRADLSDEPPETKGTYAFQAMHVGRTLDVVDRLPFMSGAIHWTLGEFEIFPGWRGGAINGPGRNTRHYKGLLTYAGKRKPAWEVVHQHYLRTPLYR